MNTTSVQYLCAPTYSCFDGCTASDAGCYTNCVESTGAAGAAYSQWSQCADDFNCFDLEGDLSFACAYDSCGEEVSSCFGIDIPSGTLSCSEFVECFAACDEDDDECFSDCDEAASSVGIGEYLDFYYCSDDAGCFDIVDFDERNACYDSACYAESLTCFGAAEFQPSGTDDCIALTSCVEACPDNDSVCINVCVDASSSEGYQDRVEFEDCVSASTDASGIPCSDLACVQSACQDEIDACYANGLL